ncbi:MAG: hypothetical protein JXA99_07795 [Candidatus Lokiarchaeota archaeon]|nr:hypothetical protein [Candidatus Lokiarchaeota archaeon]
MFYQYLTSSIYRVHWSILQGATPIYSGTWDVDITTRKILSYTGDLWLSRGDYTLFWINHESSFVSLDINITNKLYDLNRKINYYLPGFGNFEAYEALDYNNHSSTERYYFHSSKGYLLNGFMEYQSIGHFTLFEININLFDNPEGFPLDIILLIIIITAIISIISISGLILYRRRKNIIKPYRVKDQENRESKKIIKQRELSEIETKIREELMEIYIKAQKRMRYKAYTQNLIDLLQDIVNRAKKNNFINIYESADKKLEIYKKMFNINKEKEVLKLYNYAKLKLEHEQYTDETINLLNEVIRETENFKFIQIEDKPKKSLELCKNKRLEKNKEKLVKLYKIVKSKIKNKEHSKEVIDDLNYILNESKKNNFTDLYDIAQMHLDEIKNNANQASMKNER